MCWIGHSLTEALLIIFFMVSGLVDSTAPGGPNYVVLARPVTFLSQPFNTQSQEASSFASQAPLHSIQPKNLCQTEQQYSREEVGNGGGASQLRGWSPISNSDAVMTAVDWK